MNGWTKELRRQRVLGVVDGVAVVGLIELLLFLFWRLVL